MYKHIATKHHLFQVHVKCGDITVLPISMVDQYADLLTKGTIAKLFELHHE